MMEQDLRNTIKKGQVTLTNDDNGAYPTCQCRFLGKTSLTEVLYPYGIFANAPLGSFLHIFRIMNDEANLAAIATTPFKRFKNLKPGEVVIGNPITGSYVKFDEEGNIEVLSKKDLIANIEGKCDLTSAGDMTLTAPNIYLKANVVVDGAISSTGIGNFGGEDAKAIARVGDQVRIGDDVGEIITGGIGKST